MGFWSFKKAFLKQITLEGVIKCTQHPNLLLTLRPTSVRVTCRLVPMLLNGLFCRGNPYQECGLKLKCAFSCGNGIEAKSQSMRQHLEMWVLSIWVTFTGRTFRHVKLAGIASNICVMASPRGEREYPLKRVSNSWTIAAILNQYSSAVSSKGCKVI